MVRSAVAQDDISLVDFQEADGNFLSRHFPSTTLGPSMYPLDLRQICKLCPFRRLESAICSHFAKRTQVRFQKPQGSCSSQFFCGKSSQLISCTVDSGPKKTCSRNHPSFHRADERRASVGTQSKPAITIDPNGAMAPPRRRK